MGDFVFHLSIWRILNKQLWNVALVTQCLHWTNIRGAQFGVTNIAYEVHTDWNKIYLSVSISWIEWRREVDETVTDWSLHRCSRIQWRFEQHIVYEIQRFSSWNISAGLFRKRICHSSYMNTLTLTSFGLFHRLFPHATSSPHWDLGSVGHA